MFKLLGNRSNIAFATALTSFTASNNCNLTYADEEIRSKQQQPTFVSLSASQTAKKPNEKETISLDSLLLISGSAHVELSKEISKLIGVPLAAADLKRFADGEVSIQINENVRGKDVFIVQSCTAPVNDSIMELLLTVSTAR